MARRAKDFSRLSPLSLPTSAKDDEIDDFLNNPIDSRFGVDRPRTPSRAATPKLAKQQQPGTNFDWDSQLKKISSKYAQRRVGMRNPAPPRQRGLPDIAKREIILENRTLGIFDDEEEESQPEEEPTMVFPTRKNERPNIRVDPGILKAPRSTTRYG